VSASYIKKIILSPHIDDAILSLGGSILHWLNQGEHVEILTVFSRSASPFFWRKNAICNSETETILRKSEERLIADRLGDIFKYVDLPSDTCRGLKYLRPWLPTEIQSKWPCDRRTFEKLLSVLMPLFHTDTLIYAPIAPQPKAHIDHIMVRDACSAICKFIPESVQLSFYEDQPYCTRFPDLDRFLKKSKLSPQVNRVDIRAKTQLASMYKSQVRPQWLDEISSYHLSIGGERLWHLERNFSLAFEPRFTMPTGQPIEATEKGSQRLS
jgi:LmbE family N-acetylglucosaminyl deacetylase